MMPLSNDLRERILAAVDNCEGSRRQIAARFCVNVSTITRLLQLRHQTGSLDSPASWRRQATHARSRRSGAAPNGGPGAA